MSRKMISIRLSPEAVAVLDAVDDKTAHVERLLLERDRQWRAAYHALLAAGWSREALCAAADALNGYGLLHEVLGDDGTAGIALELHDAQRLNDVCAQWGVDAELWAELVKAIHERRDLAQALALLAREFWAGNRAVEQRLVSESPTSS